MKYGDPPLWFFEMYDAIQMGIPVHEGRSIRQVPLYIRFRYRLVNEALKRSRFQAARDSKAQPVVDVSQM